MGMRVNCLHLFFLFSLTVTSLCPSIFDILPFLHVLRLASDVSRRTFYTFDFQRLSLYSLISTYHASLSPLSDSVAWQVLYALQLAHSTGPPYEFLSGFPYRNLPNWRSVAPLMPSSSVSFPLVDCKPIDFGFCRMHL